MQTQVSHSNTSPRVPHAWSERRTVTRYRHVCIHLKVVHGRDDATPRAGGRELVGCELVVDHFDLCQGHRAAWWYLRFVAKRVWVHDGRTFHVPTSVLLEWLFTSMGRGEHNPQETSSALAFALSETMTTMHHTGTPTSDSTTLMAQRVLRHVRQTQLR